MQVLLNIPEGFYDDELSKSSVEEDRVIIKQAYGLRDTDEVEYVNIGLGADWIVILTTFVGVAWTIFQGPGIVKKSIDGWVWLIEKLKGFIKKDLLVSLDQDSAGLLAIDYLANKYGDDSGFDLMDAHTFKIINLEGMYPDHEYSFVAHPHNYFVFTFTIAARIIVLSVRSSGEIRELEAFDQMPYGLIDYNEE